MPTNASGVARVNGIELGYQVVGEGEPLIVPGRCQRAVDPRVASVCTGPWSFARR
jgi:hypothetical protein